MVEPGAHRTEGRWGGKSNPPLRVVHVCRLLHICFLAPSALWLQALLEMCYGFSQYNDIIFNPLKSVYVVFRPNRYEIFCPPVYLHREKLSRIHGTTYLGCFLSDDQSELRTQNSETLFRYIRS